MKFHILIVTLILGATSFAQNEEDALRYSLTYFGGTARNMGSAGALSALGGDFSNAAQNPAGLGRMTKSNFSITQNIEVNHVNTDFFGENTKVTQANYNFSNLSYVKAYELNPNKFKNWYSIQLGIGMTRVKSFNQEINYTGTTDSSILHSFAQEANGTPESAIYDWHPFSAALAYETYAIDPAGNNTYTTQFSAGKAVQTREVKRTGGITEFNLLTASGNYANKLLVGASFNYLRVKYGEYFKHKEAYTEDSLWLNSIEYKGQLDILGNGFNTRLGIIYMPQPNVRIGLAIETPTFYMMQDYWWNDMRTFTDDGERTVDPNNKPTGSYKYNVITPFKANASFAVLIKKYGSIGAEVEFVDYSGAKLADKKFTDFPYDFEIENDQIANIYRSVLNTKIGVEARFTPQLYGRLGYALYASPFTRASGNNTKPTHFITAGFGYNFGLVYLDFAYVLQKRNEDYYAYDPSINGSQSNLNISNARIAFSIGARF
jgi:hypothetical protein